MMLRRLILCLALFILAVPWGRAQTRHTSIPPQARHTFVVRGLPLGQALERLAAVAGIDLVYTSDHVSGRFAYCNGRDLEAENLLRCVLADSGLDYVRSASGAYILMEPIARPPRLGHLAGSILDAETGEPLPSANVILAEAAAGTSTNDAGHFSFSSLVSGPYRVIVTYVGYETAVDSVYVEPDAREIVRIGLQPISAAMAPIVIDGISQRLPSAGLGEISTELPSGVAGPFTPGVAVRQPLSDLSIQGGSAGEHQTLLDGVAVRDPVSLGRYLSAFSPLALGRVTVHKAGYGASHGSHLSGVVAASHRFPPGFAVSADPLSVNVRAGAGLPAGGAMMAAVRSSVWDIYRDPAVASLMGSLHEIDPVAVSRWTGRRGAPLVVNHDESDIRFSDVHLASRLHLSPYRILNASLYRAGNELFSELGAEDSDAGDMLVTRDEYAWTNWVGQVRHSWLIGARSSLTAQAKGSWNLSRSSYYGVYGPYADANDNAYHLSSEEDNRIREVSLNTTYGHALSPRHHIDSGIALSHVDSRFILMNPFVAPFRHEAQEWQVSGFAEARLQASLRIVLEPGIRLTYLPARRSVYAEPRLALRYDAPSNVALRVAAGVYRQFVNQLELTSLGATSLVPSTLFWLPLDGSMAPPRAYHTAAEALWTPTAEWSLSVELYRKWLPRALVLDYPAIVGQTLAFELDQQDFLSAVRGRAHGASLSARREGRRIDPHLSYTYSLAERRYASRFEGDWVPVPWNTPHRLRLDVETAVADRLQFVTSWEGGWGRSWGLRQSYYDYLAGASDLAPFDLDEPGEHRTPAYQRLDAGFAWRPPVEIFQAEFRLFVMNVFDRRNVRDWNLEVTSEGAVRDARLYPGRHLFLSLGASF